MNDITATELAAVKERCASAANLDRDAFQRLYLDVYSLDFPHDEPDGVYAIDERHEGEPFVLPSSDEFTGLESDGEMLAKALQDAKELAERHQVVDLRWFESEYLDCRDKARQHLREELRGLYQDANYEDRIAHDSEYFSWAFSQVITGRESDDYITALALSDARDAADEGGYVDPDWLEGRYLHRRDELRPTIVEKILSAIEDEFTGGETWSDLDSAVEDAEQQLLELGVDEADIKGLELAERFEAEIRAAATPREQYTAADWLTCAESEYADGDTDRPIRVDTGFGIISAETTDDALKAITAAVM
ncbi:MAG: hypothetical protein J5I92_15055 [Thiogranum sp.]|nr:hypothetical protein [Thiogranum sp.]